MLLCPGKRKRIRGPEVINPKAARGCDPVPDRFSVIVYEEAGIIETIP